jgi:hypothetical protein
MFAEVRVARHGTGTDQFANREMGVGHRDRIGNSPARTPPRKIRAQFLRYKHTSLITLIGEPLGFRLSLAQITVLVAFGRQRCCRMQLRRKGRGKRDEESAR